METLRTLSQRGGAAAVMHRERLRLLRCMAAAGWVIIYLQGSQYGCGAERLSPGAMHEEAGRHCLWVVPL